jgi:5-methylcytosine-specific restriction endonuclease McrA
MQDRWKDPEYRIRNAINMREKREQRAKGILPTDYAKLRGENEILIKENRNNVINWDRLRKLIYIKPRYKDRDNKKVALQPKDRLKYEIRDKGECYICGSTFHYGSCNKYLCNGTVTYKLSHLHHIIPNGDTSEENIVTLCTHCHQIVHQMMYIAGTWKYARPL